jgi:hypothetical protein
MSLRAERSSHPEIATMASDCSCPAANRAWRRSPECSGHAGQFCKMSYRDQPFPRQASSE